jgi:hypothetical protein
MCTKPFLFHHIFSCAYGHFPSSFFLNKHFPTLLLCTITSLFQPIRIDMDNPYIASDVLNISKNLPADCEMTLVDGDGTHLALLLSLSHLPSHLLKVAYITNLFQCNDI